MDEAGGVQAGKTKEADKSSSSDSSSDEEPQDTTLTTKSASKPAEVPESDADGRAGSSSSGTVMGDKKPSPEIINGDIHPARRNLMEKKKHEGARPTPLAAQSAQNGDDDYLSNKYVSYDYADRAYQDLSVTRGKGFTKEKNKKKRGSYRGGTIDMSGGKGFKFED